MTHHCGYLLNMKTIYIYIYILSCLDQFLLEWEIFQTKDFRENRKALSCSITFSFGNRDVYEIIWKNTAVPDKPHMTIWCMCVSCCTPKTTHTHSEYVMLIAFPLQQWLHQQASIFLHTYIVCLCSKFLSSQLLLRSLYLIRGKGLFHSYLRAFINTAVSSNEGGIDGTWSMHERHGKWLC